MITSEQLNDEFQSRLRCSCLWEDSYNLDYLCEVKLTIQEMRDLVNTLRVLEGQSVYNVEIEHDPDKCKKC